jgi:nitrate/TMAO reductase-like tetraheme cytochrome c subunit
MKKVFFALSTLVLIVACTPKTAEVITETTTEPVALRKPSVEESEGMTLYNANCGKCHDFKVISDYTMESWTKIVPNMAAKSKLDATQESKIMAYVKWQLGK